MLSECVCCMHQWWYFAKISDRWLLINIALVAHHTTDKIDIWLTHKIRDKKKLFLVEMARENFTLRHSVNNISALKLACFITKSNLRNCHTV